VHGSLPSTLDAVRREVQQVGSDILISDVETLEQQVNRTLIKERILSSLVTTFGALGLLLAALGLYGVAAYAVLSRTAEIGIRMALGASPAGVRWLMLRESLAMTVLGAAIGAPISLAVARLLQRLLYGVSPTDPLIIGSCVALLLGVTALAAYLPARRASRIAPVRALAL
jgi:ABC-type antimicrobial peptide transport system permease subunit